MLFKNLVVLSIAAMATSFHASADDIVRRSDGGVPERSVDWGGFHASPGLITSYVQCPAGSYVVGIQVFRQVPQVSEPLFDMRYHCRSPADGAISVRKTNPNIPDNENWPGLAGSE